MRLPIVPLLIFLLFNLGVDCYIYRQLKRLKSGVWAKAFAVVSVLLFIDVVTAISLPRRGGDNSTLLCVMWMLYTYLAFYIPRYIYLIFNLLEKLPRLWHRKPLKPWISSGLCVLTFVALWWGALVERFRIDVREVTVEVKDLPKNFDGYRIVQFSDFHVGTYDTDTTYVSEVVDRINSLNPDLIVFTGDLVNSRTSELEPHTAPLSRLHAPDGVMSILGNHDYGDYSDWPSDQHKTANLDRMKALQRSMGWNLLLNETETIRRGGDSIAVIGVENIGDPPFRIYGSLDSSYDDLGDDVTKILLSHNPAHWIDSIRDHTDKNVALTLAGHTHAMQMEVAGMSPAVFRYPTWSGLHSSEKGDNKLYVNIGVGTVGFPARIGATPEITVITLKSK